MIVAGLAFYVWVFSGGLGCLGVGWLSDCRDLWVVGLVGGVGLFRLLML